MGVYKYIYCMYVQDKSLGLLEAPQSLNPPHRRLQAVKVKPSESIITVSKCIDIDIGVGQ